MMSSVPTPRLSLSLGLWGVFKRTRVGAGGLNGASRKTGCQLVELTYRLNLPPNIVRAKDHYPALSGPALRDAEMFPGGKEGLMSSLSQKLRNGDARAL